MLPSHAPPSLGIVAPSCPPASKRVAVSSDSRVIPTFDLAPQADEAQDRLDALRQRDHAALVWFHAHHSERIDRLVFRLLGADQDHQDVVQDIFLHAVEGLDRFRGPLEALEAWLVRIAINRVRRHIRARVSRRWFVFLAPDPLPDPPAPGHTLATHALRQVEHLMRSMKPRLRMVFVMRALEGMSFPEIATAMSLSQATAKRDFAKATQWITDHVTQNAAVCRWLESQQHGSHP